MFHTSTTMKRLLVGAAALGVAIGGGVSTAGAASMRPNAHVRTATHHPRLDPKSVKESESALEATSQDHNGQGETSKTEVRSPDPTGSTDQSSSNPSGNDSGPTSGSSTDTLGSGAASIG